MTAVVPELRRRLSRGGLFTDYEGNPLPLCVDRSDLAAVLDAAEALHSARTSQEWAAAQDRWRELTGED